MVSVSDACPNWPVVNKEGQIERQRWGHPCHGGDESQPEKRMEGGREQRREGGSVNSSMLIAILLFDSKNRHVVLFYFVCNESRNCRALRQHYFLVIAAHTAVATGM